MDNNATAEAILTAKEGLVEFRKIFLNTGEDECSPAPFNYDWSDILLKGEGNDAIEGFRESAKTQYVLRAFMQYAYVFPSVARDYIVLIKKNTRLAQAKLKEIIQEYNSNPLLKHNLVKIREQSGDVFSVDVRDEKMRFRGVGNGQGQARPWAFGVEGTFIVPGTKQGKDLTAEVAGEKAVHFVQPPN